MQFNLCPALFHERTPHENQQQSDLIGYGIVAIIAAVVIYNFWHWLVGALAIFGFWFVVKEINNRNNRTIERNSMHDQLLQVLTREGVLVKVSISYWRGCKKLKAEDIGLKESQVSDRLISLGHKRLLPKEALSALALVEGRAHAYIESNTFPFLNGLAHFVPNARLQEVAHKLKEFETEFWQAKTAFLEQYASLRKSASEEWRRWRRSWWLIPIDWSPPSRLRSHSPIKWTVLWLRRAALPDQRAGEAGAGFGVTGGPAGSDASPSESSPGSSAKIRQGVETFVSDCVSSLREQTAQLCQDMLQSIETSETGVHQKTLNRLVRFIDQFKQMNFANDRPMEEMLERVRRELLTRTAEEYRDSAKARQTSGQRSATTSPARLRTGPNRMPPNSCSDSVPWASGNSISLRNRGARGVLEGRLALSPSGLSSSTQKPAAIPGR